MFPSSLSVWDKCWPQIGFLGRNTADANAASWSLLWKLGRPLCSKTRGKGVDMSTPDKPVKWWRQALFSVCHSGSIHKTWLKHYLILHWLVAPKSCMCVTFSHSTSTSIRTSSWLSQPPGVMFSALNDIKWETWYTRDSPSFSIAALLGLRFLHDATHHSSGTSVHCSLFLHKSKTLWILSVVFFFFFLMHLLSYQWDVAPVVTIPQRVLHNITDGEWKPTSCCPAGCQSHTGVLTTVTRLSVLSEIISSAGI